MATDIVEQRRGAVSEFIDKPDWQSLGEHTYECRVLICPEKSGGFSAFVLRLPGVVSQGDSIEDAIENIADAFQAAIQTYLEGGGIIPWRDQNLERATGCFERWILVNV